MELGSHFVELVEFHAKAKCKPTFWKVVQPRRRDAKIIYWCSLSQNLEVTIKVIFFTSSSKTCFSYGLANREVPSVMRRDRVMCMGQDCSAIQSSGCCSLQLSDTILRSLIVPFLHIRPMNVSRRVYIRWRTDTVFRWAVVNFPKAVAISFVAFEKHLSVQSQSWCPIDLGSTDKL